MCNRIKQRMLQSSIFVLLAFCIGIVQAALPVSLNYQGYLSNTGGSPVNNASQSIAFTLYDSDVGGATLWTDTFSVNVVNGAFSVELGSGGNPLPQSAFDNPVWVGVKVGADTEMTPRRALDLSAYAIKAEDANTVNGLQANEIIAAAADEVRTPINTLPFFINSPGSYYLTSNLASGSDGIIITVDNVTIDFMGFAIDGNTGTGRGVDLTGRSHVIIRNGTIQNFGMAGIYSFGAGGEDVVILDMQLIRNGQYGASYDYSGIYLDANNSRIQNCSINGSGGYGIFVRDNSQVIGNRVWANSGGNGIYVGPSGIVRNNTVNNNAYDGIFTEANAVVTGNNSTYNGGSGIIAGSGSKVSGNTAEFNLQEGIHVSGSSTIKNNTASQNYGPFGIYGDNGSNLSGNTALSNAGDGIVGGTASILKDNIAMNNTGNSGISAGIGSIIIGNIASNNTNFGIFSNDSSNIRNNTATGNNTFGSPDIGGIRIGNFNKVKDNTADANNDVGFFIEGIGNTIEGNMASNQTSGFNFFTGSGNHFKGNRATGNINNYLNTGTNLDGGDNVSF